MFSWLKKRAAVAPEEGQTVILSSKPEVGLLPRFEAGSLAGKCLVATPYMDDSRFKKAVVFICSHSERGAMGLIINHPLDEPSFPELLEQFKIEPTEDMDDLTIVHGGPIENGYGFVLHSADHKDRSTQTIQNYHSNLQISSSLDVLRLLAQGEGPRQTLLALGYTGWDAGQLEAELAEHVWLVTDCDEALLFDISCNHRWETALARIGVAPAFMSQAAGRA